MGDYSQLSRHFWQTQAMARAMEIDLNGALRQGRAHREDYAGAIVSCASCDHYGKCLTWLAGHGAGVGTPPEFCAIIPWLEKLR